MDSDFVLFSLHAVEYAALKCFDQIGHGDEKKADQVAVDAMRQALNRLDIQGTVVIGEGERDKAPMLYIGEKVGCGKGPCVDIALDPLEGTTLCAMGSPGALSVLAMAHEGGFLNAPDVYMDKIAVGPGLAKNVVDLDASIKENLTNLARAKKVDVKDLSICMLNRPRHQNAIDQIRQMGARIILIQDGDVAGVISTALPSCHIDLYMGTGGAPEGVLSAAALRCIGGQFQGRLLFGDEDEKKRAQKWGIVDLDRKYDLEDLAKGDVVFAATGVTDGGLLNGVEFSAQGAKTHSVVMDSKTGLMRFIESFHPHE